MWLRYCKLKIVTFNSVVTEAARYAGRLKIPCGRRPQALRDRLCASIQGPHQAGKSGKSREFCDRSGKCREKQNTLKNVVVSGKKYFFLYRGLGLDLFSS